MIYNEVMPVPFSPCDSHASITQHSNTGNILIDILQQIISSLTVSWHAITSGIYPIILSFKNNFLKFQPSVWNSFQVMRNRDIRSVLYSDSLLSIVLRKKGYLVFYQCVNVL